jgi:hypothetical protein
MALIGGDLKKPSCSSAVLRHAGSSASTNEKTG